MIHDTLKDIPVSFSASGDNTLVSAVSGKQIRIYKLWLVFGGDTTIAFKDGASTHLSGTASMKEGGSIVLDDTQSEPWFKTSIGNGFVANLGSAVPVAGMAYYRTDE